jgi:hypothetical protein
MFEILIGVSVAVLVLVVYPRYLVALEAIEI